MPPPRPYQGGRHQSVPKPWKGGRIPQPVHPNKEVTEAIERSWEYRQKKIRKEALEGLGRQLSQEAYENNQDIYDAFKNSPEWQNELAKIQGELDKIDELEDLLKSGKTPGTSGANPSRIGGIKIPPIADDLIKGIGHLGEQIAKSPVGGFLRVAGTVGGKIFKVIDILGTLLDLKQGIENLIDPVTGLPGYIKLLQDPSKWMGNLDNIDPGQLVNSIIDDTLEDFLGFKSPRQQAVDKFLEGLETRARNEEDEYVFTRPGSFPSPDTYPGIESLPSPVNTRPDIGLDPNTIHTIGGDNGWVFLDSGKSAWIGTAKLVDWNVVIRGSHWGSDRVVQYEMLEYTLFGDGHWHEWKRNGNGFDLRQKEAIPSITRQTIEDFINLRVEIYIGGIIKYRYPNRVAHMQKYRELLSKARQNMSYAGSPSFDKARIRYKDKKTGEISITMGTLKALRDKFPLPSMERATKIPLYPPLLLSKPPNQQPTPTPLPKVRRENNDMRCCPQAH
ncbi:hypothetical protein [Roseofilum sp. Belize Diploria]|uniref:hypothetical protein n=1 Tax=Roseofilum sp. Belize Diploria TaxID=2821501 RepID=UPI001B1F8E80|nr:hypothetical protein [Roseofilum sp. Belize Diploria]MBP0011487.1 hypothetical protein [Roseofilum sp. Belize Diploria]